MILSQQTGVFMMISTNQPAFLGTIKYYGSCQELKPVEQQMQDVIDQKQVDLYIAKGTSGFPNASSIYLFRATKNPERLSKTYGVKILTRFKYSKDADFYKEVIDTVNNVSDIAISRNGGMTFSEKVVQYFRKMMTIFR